MQHCRRFKAANFQQMSETSCALVMSTFVRIHGNVEID